MSAKWGKLSCAILAQDWDAALEELNKLKRDIDETVRTMLVGREKDIVLSLCIQINTPHLRRLQYRAWLIHWSLFVFFNHPKGQDEIIKIFLFEPESVMLAIVCVSNLHDFLSACKIVFAKFCILIFFKCILTHVCSYLNAIQTCCPHIFRYITAAVITNKKRQTLLKDLVRVIKHVSL